MNEVDQTNARVKAAIADGTYSEAEHRELSAVFEAMRLKQKLALLRELTASMKTMPGGGDHGAWTALMQIQDHLRRIMPGLGGTAPKRRPPDFNKAKKLLKSYAYDGALADDERLELKRLLVHLDARHVQRLYNFARRREEFAFQPARKTGFLKVRHFIEEHAEGSEWKLVDVDESVE